MADDDFGVIAATPDKSSRDGIKVEDFDEDGFASPGSAGTPSRSVQQLLQRSMPARARRLGRKSSDASSASSLGRNTKRGRPKASPKVPMVPKKTSPKAKKVAKISLDPCWVCGKKYADMPVNSRYCWQHERSVSSLRTSYQPKKGTPKDAPNPKADELAAFKELEQQTTPPPSDFSKMILNYEVHSPFQGVGKARKPYSTVTYVQNKIQKTGLRSQFEGEWMTKYDFFTWGTEEKKWPTWFVTQKWKWYEDNIADDDKANTDEAGNDPDGNKRRYLVHKRDTAIGFTEAALENVQQLGHGKADKIKNQEQLEDGWADMRGQSIGFGNSMFRGVGGEFAVMAARQSSSATLGVGARSSFEVMDGSTADKTEVTELLQFDNEEVKKDLDVEKTRMKLNEKLNEYTDGLKVKIADVYEKHEHAKKLSTTASDMVAQMPSYIDIMNRRMAFLAPMAIELPRFKTLISEYMSMEEIAESRYCKERFEEVQSYQEAVVRAKALGNNMVASEVEKLNKILAPAAENQYLLLLLRKCGWLDGLPTENPCLDELLQGLDLYLHATLADAAFRMIAQRTMDKRQAAPCEVTEDIVVPAQLQFLSFISLQIDSSDFLKNELAVFARNKKQIDKMISKIKSGCTDIETAVERAEKKIANDEKQSQRQKEKEVEKLATQQKKQAEKQEREAKKASAKESRKTKTSVDPNKLPPLLKESPAALTLQAVHQPVPRFRCLAHLQKAVTSVDPYMVGEVSFHSSMSKPYIIEVGADGSSIILREPPHRCLLVFGDSRGPIRDL